MSPPSQMQIREDWKNKTMELTWFNKWGGKTDPFIYLCNFKRAEKLVELIFY